MFKAFWRLVLYDPLPLSGNRHDNDLLAGTDINGKWVTRPRACPVTIGECEAMNYSLKYSSYGFSKFDMNADERFPAADISCPFIFIFGIM